ncbi:ankyrin repeat-containing protein [Penicillium angulare]|uniref:ankyrin repeat-containing protein n=1 Tax=Penicillium angulare TaxID=116970 RepID=UPI0025411A88|nr:ankyrin repeat-containing protein [Penicillium angulare]KAJ5278688.1 ankyrin repeat-containing protein [Penicillium angulare]
MPLNPFRPHEGPPVYQEEYRNTSYVPSVIETAYGFQLVAPDTPYVAATGRNKLYFIDTRFDNETAQHIKNQIEKATIPILDQCIVIDEIAATAKRRNGENGETTFVFDPLYARFMFAKGINKRNPDIKLPEYENEPDGDWLVACGL